MIFQRHLRSKSGAPPAGAPKQFLVWLYELSRDQPELKPVAGASEYGTKMDQFNRVTFTPVKTSALRIEAQLQATWSGGILEWEVQ